MLTTLTLRDESQSTAEWATRCEELGVMLANVTYSSLFGHVESVMGDAMLSADQEWLVYVRDFMRTIESLGEPEMQYDRDLFEFMQENEPEARLLAWKMREVTQATRTHGERLRAMMGEGSGPKGDEPPKTCGVAG